MGLQGLGEEFWYVRGVGFRAALSLDPEPTLSPKP